MLPGLLLPGDPHGARSAERNVLIRKAGTLFLL